MQKLLTFIFLAVTVLGTSCSKDSLTGKIEVKGIKNPDAIAPVISFITTAPAAMDGWQDFELEYSVDDKESGLRDVKLYYSPDVATKAFKLVGNIPFGENQSVQFCVPNRNNPKGTFKIIAIDNAGNQASEMLGDKVGEDFTVNVDNDPIVPAITSSLGVLISFILFILLLSAASMINVKFL